MDLIHTVCNIRYDTYLRHIIYSMRMIIGYDSCQNDSGFRNPSKVFRIEARAVTSRKTEKEDGVKLGSRFDHMALIVKLNDKWFLCDCG